MDKLADHYFFNFKNILYVLKLSPLKILKWIKETELDLDEILYREELSFYKINMNPRVSSKVLKFIM